jgi:hypothetical protein
MIKGVLQNESFVAPSFSVENWSFVDKLLKTFRSRAKIGM